MWSGKYVGWHFQNHHRTWLIGDWINGWLCKFNRIYVTGSSSFTVIGLYSCWVFKILPLTISPQWVAALSIQKRHHNRSPPATTPHSISSLISDRNTTHYSIDALMLHHVNCLFFLHNCEWKQSKYLCVCSQVCVCVSSACFCYEWSCAQHTG